MWRTLYFTDITFSLWWLHLELSPVISATGWALKMKDLTYSNLGHFPMRSQRFWKQSSLPRECSCQFLTLFGSGITLSPWGLSHPMPTSEDILVCFKYLSIWKTGPEGFGGAELKPNNLFVSMSCILRKGLWGWTSVDFHRKTLSCQVRSGFNTDSHSCPIPASPRHSNFTSFEIIENYSSFNPWFPM